MSVLRMLEAGKYVMEETVNISGLSLDEVKKLKAKRTVYTKTVGQESKKQVPGLIFLP